MCVIEKQNSLPLEAHEVDTINAKTNTTKIKSFIFFQLLFAKLSFKNSMILLETNKKVV